LSIAITITSYVILVIVPGAVHLREASGYPNELPNNFYLNCSLRVCSEGLYHNANVKIIMCNNLTFTITIYVYTGIFTGLTINIILC
jgi:hypothetical protein